MKLRLIILSFLITNAYSVNAQLQIRENETDKIFCLARKSNSFIESKLLASYVKPDDNYWVLISFSSSLGYGKNYFDSTKTYEGQFNANFDLGRFGFGINGLGGLGVGTVGYELIATEALGISSFVPIYLYFPLLRRSDTSIGKQYKFLYLFAGGSSWATNNHHYLHEGIGYLYSFHSTYGFGGDGYYGIELRAGIHQSDYYVERKNHLGWYIALVVHLGSVVF